MAESDPFSEARFGELHMNVLPPQRYRAFDESIRKVDLFRSLLARQHIQPEAAGAELVTRYVMPTYTADAEGRALRGVMLREIFYIPSNTGTPDVVYHEHPSLPIAFTHLNGYAPTGPLGLQPILDCLPTEERERPTILHDVASALEIWSQAMRRYASVRERMHTSELDRLIDVPSSIALAHAAFKGSH